MTSAPSSMHLYRPGVLSALGSGMEATVERLLDPAPSSLTLSDQWVAGRTLPLGQVTEPLRPFDAALPDEHRSRNNQLLWHAMAQVEPALSAACRCFGPDRIGVVLGTSTSGVDENLPAFRHMVDHGQWQESAFSQAHQLLCSPVDFIQAQYGLSGIGYAISTACTSGARALASAARLLKLGLCDAVLCGGVDSLSLLTINGFASLEVVSGRVARPFAADRDGINIGEAAAVFLMTRVPMPGFPEGEPIGLLGYGASSDAWHMSSPRPDGEGAMQAIQAALQGAGLSAGDLGWINLHGTGTAQNDAMESLAVVQTLGVDVPGTSTKPHTGHTLGAAGALEAAIVWGFVSRQLNPSGALPAHGNERDPSLAPLRLTRPGDRWPSGRRLGLSTSFAFGGNNMALIMGDTA